MSALYKRYKEQMVPQLCKQLKLANPMQAPKLVKVTLNMGVGEVTRDKKALDHAIQDLQSITGQKPVITLARKGVANFKIRKGWPVGCKVTLRRQRMYEFMERLITVTIPRIRDFRGFSPRSFDEHGNYSLGIKEQMVFSEIDFDKLDATRGLDICITTSAQNKEQSLALLQSMNFPIRN